MDTPRRPGSRPAAALAALSAAALLGSCGTGSSTTSDAQAAASSSTTSPAPAPPSASGPDSPTSTVPGTPPGGRLMPLRGLRPQVRWIAGLLYVRAAGSSSCPPVARSVKVAGHQTLVIDVSPKVPKGIACTDDLTGHSSQIAAPDGVDKHEPVTVRLLDQGKMSDPIPVDVIDATYQ